MNRVLFLAAVALVAAGLARPAEGRIGTGVAILMAPPESGVAAGQLYQGRLQLLAHREMELTDFFIEGDDWLGLTWTSVAPGSHWI